MKKETLFVEEHRDLSTKEIDLIKWLLTKTNHSEFIEQIRKTKVVSKCSCGCPTIDLQVEGYENKPLKLILSAEGFSPEGSRWCYSTCEEWIARRTGSLFPKWSESFWFARN